MKRAIVLITVFLTAGAIVNVAVAWGSAVFWGFDNPEEPVRGFRSSDAGAENIYIYEQFAGLRISWFRKNEPGPEASEGPEPQQLMPSWVTAPRSVPQDASWVMWDIEARGAPCVSLWSTIWEARKGLDGSIRRLETSGSIHLPISDFSSQVMLDLPRVLPLRPIWPGFAINTIFYAAILWMLWATPFALRRRMRIKRNRCPACGYDRTGLPPAPPPGHPCPECGCMRGHAEERQCI